MFRSYHKSGMDDKSISQLNVSLRPDGQNTIVDMIGFDYLGVQHALYKYTNNRFMFSGMLDRSTKPELFLDNVQYIWDNLEEHFAMTDHPDSAGPEHEGPVDFYKWDKVVNQILGWKTVYATTDIPDNLDELRWG